MQNASAGLGAAVRGGDGGLAATALRSARWAAVSAAAGEGICIITTPSRLTCLLSRAHQNAKKVHQPTFSGGQPCRRLMGRWGVTAANGARAAPIAQPDTAGGPGAILIFKKSEAASVLIRTLEGGGIRCLMRTVVVSVSVNHY